MMEVALKFMSRSILEALVYAATTSWTTNSPYARRAILETFVASIEGFLGGKSLRVEFGVLRLDNRRPDFASLTYRR